MEFEVFSWEFEDFPGNPGIFPGRAQLRFSWFSLQESHEESPRIPGSLPLEARDALEFQEFPSLKVRAEPLFPIPGFSGIHWDNRSSYPAFPAFP